MNQSNRNNQKVTISKPEYRKLISSLLDVETQLSDRVDEMSPVGHLLSYKQFHTEDKMVQVGGYVYHYSNPIKDKAGHLTNLQQPITPFYYRVIMQQGNNLIVQKWHRKD